MQKAGSKGPRPSSRWLVLPKLGFFFLGIILGAMVAGLWVNARAPSAVGALSGKTVKSRIRSESNHKISKADTRFSPDEIVSLTPEQLHHLSSGYIQIRLDSLIGSMNSASNRIFEPSFDAQFESLISPLNLNSRESELLKKITRSSLTRLMQLQRDQLEIKQPEPGRLIFDYDALAPQTQAIMDELRTEIKNTLGRSVLLDLDALVGFDLITHPIEPSQNLEFELRDSDGARILTRTFYHDTEKRSKSIGIEGNPTFVEALQQQSFVSNSLRHLLDRIPKDPVQPR